MKALFNWFIFECKCVVCLSFNHPHIVAVIVFTHSGIAYMYMVQRVYHTPHELLYV